MFSTPLVPRAPLAGIKVLFTLIILHLTVRGRNPNHSLANFRRNLLLRPLLLPQNLLFLRLLRSPLVHLLLTLILRESLPPGLKRKVSLPMLKLCRLLAVMLTSLLLHSSRAFLVMILLLIYMIALPLFHKRSSVLQPPFRILIMTMLLRLTLSRSYLCFRILAFLIPHFILVVFLVVLLSPMSGSSHFSLFHFAVVTFQYSPRLIWWLLVIYKLRVALIGLLVPIV